jgi:hypothetical protein
MKPEALIEAYFAGIRDGSVSFSFDPVYGRWTVILAVGHRIIEKSSPRLVQATVDAMSAMDALLYRPLILPPPPAPKSKRQAD